MALGDPYVTLAELKTRLGIGDTNDDTRLTDALSSVSREIEKHCDRQFNKATAATARIYYPRDRCLVKLDDFHTITDLVIKTDEDDDGTYETTWSASDYQLEPLNGIVDGELGWPYYRIRAVSGRYFPRNRRASVQVTAQWGWTAVPAPVKESCYILAQETAKLTETPFGVGGYGQFGIIKVRDNPMAARKLQKYERDPVKAA